MKPVSRELMVEVWDWMCGLEEEPTRKLVKQFMEEQPGLGMYLLACNEELGKEAEQSPLIELTVAVWKAMTNVSGSRLKTVKPGVIERAEKANMQMLTRLEPASEFEQEDKARQVFHEYPQREVLGFCIEIMMREDEETPELAPDRVGLEWMWLKTIVDCLDQ